MKEFTKRNQSRRTTLAVLREQNGHDEALAIIDEGGEMSLLRFEPKLKATEPGFRQPSCCQSPLNVLSSITLPPPPTDKA